MKIYISGPITGTDDYEERFEEAEKYLRRGSEYFYEPDIVINPVKYAGLILQNAPWSDFIEFCLKVLRCCDVIYMLKGWENSKGAQIEKLYAEALNISIWFEDKGEEDEDDY